MRMSQPERPTNPEEETTPPSAPQPEPPLLSREEDRGGLVAAKPDSSSDVVHPELEDDYEALEGEEIPPSVLVRRLEAVFQQTSGPIPSPGVLKAYRDVDPRVLEWVLDNASNEQATRHWCYQEPLRQSSRAQVFAFVLALIVVLIGGLLIYLDKPTEGFALILSELGILLAVFLYRESRSRKLQNELQANDTAADRAESS